jgi:NDP-sugar pyrophosphorylase family protein
LLPTKKKGIAKALLSIGNPGVCLIDHHITNLRQQGIKKVVVATGDQEQVFEYISDVYVYEDDVVATKSSEQLGTGGDLIEYARQDKSSEIIVVQNVDTILNISLESFLQEHNDKGGLGRIATIALTLNKGVPNEDAFAVSESNVVMSCKEFSEFEESLTIPVKYRASSTGAVVVSTRFLRSIPWQTNDGQLSLYRNILKDAWEVGGLFSYDNGKKFFRDIGTVATWLASEDDVELQRYLRYNEAI